MAAQNNNRNPRALEILHNKNPVDRTECSSVLAFKSLVMKCACPKSAPPKQQPLACLCAKSDCVGVCDSCKDAITTGWHRPLLFQICVFPNAMRSLPVSITGVPTHDAQLRSALVVRQKKCRPGNPSGNLWAAKSPTQQQINLCCPREKRIKWSPCSPPSPRGMVWQTPSSSSQMYCQSRPLNSQKRKVCPPPSMLHKPVIKNTILSTPDQTPQSVD